MGKIYTIKNRKEAFFLIGSVILARAEKINWFPAKLLEVDLIEENKAWIFGVSSPLHLHVNDVIYLVGEIKAINFEYL